MDEIPKPVPVPDERSRPFWEAASRHVLAIQRCDHCSRFAHPPVIICPACLNTNPSFTFTPVTGNGRLATWTIMRDAFLPGFRPDIPWAIGEAELDGTNGTRLIARLAHPADTPFHPGLPMRTIFHDTTTTGITLPLLQLTSQP